jgi:2-hydroxychromene-2-carboxylate isomerase
VLVAWAEAGAQRFINRAAALSSALWSHAANLATGLDPADAATTSLHLAASDRLRRELGHYLGATFRYAGKWYWGVDRLCHLEPRLQALGALRAGAAKALLLLLEPDLQATVVLADPSPIDFFISLRSPYTAIVAARVFDLGRLMGAQVRLRCVLPMVMRGLPVPQIKSRDIALDCARVALVPDTLFGRVKYQLSRPTEGGMALILLAEGLGLGPGWVSVICCPFCTASGTRAWTPAATAACAASPSAPACAGLTHARPWPTRPGARRPTPTAMPCSRRGLWGVSSFAVRDTAVWGQDRLWAVQQALLSAQKAAPPHPRRAQARTEQEYPMNLTLNDALRSGGLVALVTALARLAGWLPATAVPNASWIAAGLLAAHTLEVLLFMKYLRRYCGPLAVSVMLTLVFDVLHWKPLADEQAKRSA